MKRTLWLAFLPSLVACSASNNPNAREAFPFENDPDRPYLTRNGDNYGIEGVGRAYQDVMRELSKDDFIQNIENGESFLIYLHQDNCRNCQAAHDDILNFLLDSEVMMYSVHFTPDNIPEKCNMLNDLGAEFPSLSNVLDGEYHTPDMILFKNAEKAYPVSFYSERNPLQNLYNFFKNLFNFTYVYHFSAWDQFESFVQENDCLAYVNGLDEPSFFYENIYPKAKVSEKITAVLDSELMTENELAKFNEKYGKEKTLFTIEKGQKKRSLDVVDQRDDSLEMIRDYYGF